MKKTYGLILVLLFLLFSQVEAQKKITYQSKIFKKVDTKWQSPTIKWASAYRISGSNNYVELEYLYGRWKYRYKKSGERVFRSFIYSGFKISPISPEPNPMFSLIIGYQQKRLTIFPRFEFGFRTNPFGETNTNQYTGYILGYRLKRFSTLFGMGSGETVVSFIISYQINRY